MKDNTASLSRFAVAVSFGLFGLCVFLGVITAYRLVGGAFSKMADCVCSLTFDGVSFLPGFKKAVTGDLIFCLSVLFFTTGVFGWVFPGCALLVKGFFMGAVAGLAAKCLIMKKAAEVFFAVFISNFLVLPLWILLTLAAMNFSLNWCSVPRGERVKEYLCFLVKVLMFFILMCLAQLIQIGIGVGVINIGR